MKTITNLLTLVLLMLMLNTNAQDKRFTAYTFGHPLHSDGFNIGIGVDYQMTIMYFKAHVYTFPDLNGITYTELAGGVGINKHFGMFDTVRIFAGIKAGVLHRNGPYRLLGGEIGIEYYIPNTNIFVGYNGHYTHRQDGRQWNINAEDYWRGSSFLKVGITF